MLEAIETTALETQQRVTNINIAMDKAKELVKAKKPKIYSKDLIETVFEHPYCKFLFSLMQG